ncbi:hypothetical protein [Ammoniphilus sp. YIM 78166]|uniref:hypothetical protein n=1 Tax=Ammoniphilus sp. YIM 78166 TaxID=1644106 RepID=UPI00106FB7EB|nr:hypothetical protein [Ammoniphilus sp. YIM 78166]
MTKDQWVAQLSEALQHTTSYEFLQLLGTNQNLLIQLGEHFTVEYVQSKLGDALLEDMGKLGLDTTDTRVIIQYIKDYKDLYRDHLQFKSPEYDQATQRFAAISGFSTLVEMLAKTENVNRSNVNAVLVVASRKSDELKNLVQEIQTYFEQDAEEISLFFKRYFEEVEGWKFNKLNRKEKEGKGKESTEKLMRQLAYWILFEPEKDPMGMWIKLFKLPSQS